MKSTLKNTKKINKVIKMTDYEEEPVCPKCGGTYYGGACSNCCACIDEGVPDFDDTPVGRRNKKR